MTPPDLLLARWRRVSVRIAGVIGLILFGFFFSVVAAEAMDIIQAGTEGSPRDPAPSPEARLGAAHPGEAVHVVGALSVLVIGVSGLVGMIARPHRSGYAYQVLSTMLAVLITLPIVGDPNNVGGQAGWIDPVLLVIIVPSIVAGLLALPWGRWSSGRAKPGLLVLAAVAVVPAAWYGIDQALIQRNTFPPTADPHHNAHWWVMGVAAFTLILAAAGAGLPSQAWRLAASLAGVGAIAAGLASILDPSAASAVSTIAAIAALLWGVAALSLTVRDRERAPG